MRAALLKRLGRIRTSDQISGAVSSAGAAPPLDPPDRIHSACFRSSGSALLKMAWVLFGGSGSVGFLYKVPLQGAGQRGLEPTV